MPLTDIWQEPLTESERSIIEKLLDDPNAKADELKRWMRLMLAVLTTQ